MSKRYRRRGGSARTERSERAEKMLQQWRELTPQQQLAALDERLGKGLGARKQRRRLEFHIEVLNAAGVS